MSDTNRYPVNPLDGAAGFAEWRKDIERRLSALEGAPLVGTQMTVKDTGGNVRVLLGLLDDATNYGLQVFDADGVEAVNVSGSGFENPVFQVPIRPAAYAGSGAFITTSGTFTSTTDCVLGKITHEAIRLQHPVGTDSGTTAEVRLVVFVNGTITYTSGTQSVASGTSNTNRMEWNWAPGWPIGSYGRYAVMVQVRRASGSGNVTSGEIDFAFVASSDAIGAAATGF